MKAIGIVLLALGVLVVSVGKFLSDFRAEAAGSRRNRKFGLEAASMDPDEERHLEQLLHERVGDVDVAGVMQACGIRADPLSLACTRRPVEPRVYILGERHSGTNIASALAYSNFDLDMEPAPKVRAVLGPNVMVDDTVRKEFGMNNHKHNMQTPTGFYGGLSIICIRNPYDWIRAMMRECYFCEDRNKHAKTVQEFVQVRAPHSRSLDPAPCPSLAPRAPRSLARFPGAMDGRGTRGAAIRRHI